MRPFDRFSFSTLGGDDLFSPITLAPRDGLSTAMSQFAWLDETGVSPSSFAAPPAAGPSDDHGDTRDTATDLGTLTERLTRSGDLGAEGDIDYFSFTTTQTVFTLDILSGLEGTIQAMVYDADGNLVAQTRDYSPRLGSSDFDRFAGWQGEAGTYFVAVSHTDPTVISDYSFTIRTQQDDAEGDSLAEATALPRSALEDFGILFGGNFGGDADQDWFSLEVEAGETLRFSLQDGSFGGLTLSLYTADGTVLQSLEASDDFDTSSYATFDTAQTLYLSIDGASPGAFGGYNFQIEISETYGPDDVAGDPSTTAVVVNDRIIGTWEDTGTPGRADTDWFALTLAPGESFVLINPDTGEEVRDYYVYNAEGRQFTRYAPFSVDRFILPEDYPADTPVYISISPALAPFPGPRLGPYEFEVKRFFDVPGNQFVDTSTLSPVQIGAPYDGEYEYRQDEDYFILEVTEANQRFSFDLGPRGRTETLLSIALADSINANLVVNTPDSFEYQFVQTGTYVIKLEAAGNFTGNYQLTVNQVASQAVNASILSAPTGRPTVDNVENAILLNDQASYSVAAGEVLFQTDTTEFQSDFGSPIIEDVNNLTNSEVTVAGTVWRYSDNSDATGVRVEDLTVTSTGRIIAETTELDGAPSAERGGGATAVVFLGGNLENRGEIAASTDAGSATAITTDDPFADIGNSGTITARAELVLSNPSASGGAQGVVMSNGGQLRNQEGGSIIVEGFAATAVSFGRGNFAGGGGFTPHLLTNEGLIEANSISPNDQSVGVRISGLDSETGSIVNSGTIRADIAIQVTQGFVSSPEAINASIFNQEGGVIDGDIIGYFGDEIVRNNGSIDGDISLGQGNDFVTNTLGTISGLVDLGLGDDMFRGGEGSDYVVGGLGNDLLEGIGGADVILGGGGDDQIFGDDVANGGTESADYLSGGAGNDSITAGSGDLIKGGAGDDMVIVNGEDFASADGGAGFDTIVLSNFDGPERRFDLADIVASGRLTGFEAINLEFSDTIILTQQSVLDFAGGETLSVSAGQVILAGGWTEVSSDDDTMTITYQLGDAEVVIDGGTNVTLVNATPTDGRGLQDAAAGPSVAPSDQGLEDMDAEVISDLPGLLTDLVIDEGVTVQAVENVVAIQVPTGRFQPTVTNNGTIRAEGVDIAGASGARGGGVGLNGKFGDIVNNGLIEAIAYEDGFAFGLLEVGGFGKLTNSEDAIIRATSENGDAYGVWTFQGGDLESSNIINEGRIEAVSLTGRAFGLLVRQGDNAVIGGDIYADAGDFAIGVAVQFGFGAATFTGNIRAVVDKDSDFRSVAVETGMTDVIVTETARLQADIGVFIENNGFGNTLTNAGQIDGEVIFRTFFDDFAVLSLTNSGIMIGGFSILTNPGGTESAIITNTGSMTGTIVMGGGRDVFDSGAGQHTGDVFLRGGNDRAIGSGQDEGFDGGAGNDVISGRGGSDILVGGDGNDELQGDFAIQLTGFEGELYRAYRAVFGRDPDKGGFEAFLTELRLGRTDQSLIITEFVASAEFQATYGELTNREFVELLYTNVLPGNQDQVGRDNFTAALDNGSLTREAMVVEFANSPEFILLTTDDGAAFATNIALDPSEFSVFRIYQAVFNRDPDAGGFNAFTGSLQAGILSVEQITAEFVASAEFQATYGSLSNAEFVELLYDNVLPGNEDPAGRAAFTSALDSGSLSRAKMVAEFVESFEFIQAQTGAARDFISGIFSAFNDVLDGGAGDDVMSGGRGADIFVASDGQDEVMDFTLGTDRIALADFAASYADFAALSAAISQDGADTLITLADGAVMRLRNVVADDLAETDFIFGSDGGGVAALSDFNDFDTAQALSGLPSSPSDVAFDPAQLTRDAGPDAGLDAGEAEAASPSDIYVDMVDAYTGYEDAYGDAWV